MTAFPQEKVARARVLVVGDIMLDRYWFGEVERISPEAPVPVVRVARRENRLGGAANVARNISALGGNTTLIGVVGDDEAGVEVEHLAAQDNIATRLVTDPVLHTTLKMRVLGRQQQMLRIDFEEYPGQASLDQIQTLFAAQLPHHDVVVLSDYAKGTLAHVDVLIEMARAANRPVLVDPKGHDYQRYKGASIITPNRQEMREAVGYWSSEADLEMRAQALRHKLALEALLVTRSEQGMTLFLDDLRFHVDAAAQEVFDVSGAGDTVLATLALSRRARMIVVTGGAGFIGSNIVKGLNARGMSDILVVDDLTDGDKFINLVNLNIADYLHKDVFRERLLKGQLSGVEAVFHQGACSDTTERNGQYMMDNNYRVTLELFEWCQQAKVPFIYASSAAVYGAGPSYVEDIQYESPLNVYGYSKFLFDQVLRRRLNTLSAPVAGLRYFNVYGPNEQHKGRMSSVAFHNANQYREESHVRLFGGWDGYPDGGQQRDFIYVDDAVEVNLYFLEHPEVSGVFNCGTGRAQPFNDVACAVVNALRMAEGESELSLQELVDQQLIHYIDFPEDLKGRYQSHTQADLTQLRKAGYDKPFHDVYTGVTKYIQHLLEQGRL